MSGLKTTTKSLITRVKVNSFRTVEVETTVSHYVFKLLSSDFLLTETFVTRDEKLHTAPVGSCHIPVCLT